jgi:phosphatidylserine/phosphatidylglycerophosphate/cardiolipin synthase-like enzyme
MKKYIISSLLLLISQIGESKISVCFTPGQDCTKLIINTLDDAKKSVLIQAYYLTSPAISAEIVALHDRGIDVKIILDKSQINQGHYSSAKFFANHNIPVWIDNTVRIAHNKVMIIDHKTVITGSFNFTKSAQYHNAENLLVIDDENIAKLYTSNWQRRLASASAE